MKRIATLILLLTFVASDALGQGASSGAVTDSGPQAMADAIFVEFDQVYIPALALTNQKKPTAHQALARLSKSWDEKLVGQFHRLFSNDSLWPRDVSHVAQCIALSEAQLKAGESMKAHEELEPIRDLLTEARHRNHVAYPLDSLSRFHATMEGIVKPAMKLEPNTLTNEKIAEFANLAERAEQEWKVVEQAPYDLDVFDKTAAQQAKFPAMLKAEGKAIQQLRTALRSGAKPEIIKSARGLKPPFAKVYMFFGDFPKSNQ